MHDDMTAAAKVRWALVHEDPSDYGNARRFVARFGDRVRYNVPEKQWHVWDGTRWQPDRKGKVHRLAKKVMKELRHAAVDSQDVGVRKGLIRWALTSSNRRKLDDMLAVASTEIELVVTPEMLDKDGWVLNVENGTVDLRTGALRPHAQGDLITKLAPVTYDAQAECPRFLAFLDTVFCGSEALIRYIQRVVGCCLTGLPGVKALFVFYGSGDNGKTTLVDLLLLLLGEYAKTVNVTTLLMSSTREGGGQHRDDVAQLPGVRFVEAGEPSRGSKLNVALIKKLTGGDPETTRAIFGRTFTFQPVAKFVVHTNARPEIGDNSPAIWGRVKPVPFGAVIPVGERVENYHVKLAEELPGILKWAVAGCLAWQRDGRLVDPEEVTLSREEYREEMAGFVRWREERTVLEPGARTSTAALFKDYEGWCTGEKIAQPLNAVWFGRSLGTVSTVTDDRTNKSKGWIGIRLVGDGNDGNSESSHEKSTLLGESRKIGVIPSLPSPEPPETSSADERFTCPWDFTDPTCLCPACAGWREHVAETWVPHEGEDVGPRDRYMAYGSPATDS